MPTDKADIFTLAMFGDMSSFLKKFDISRINDKLNDDCGLLHLAITGNHSDIASFLIEKGIDVNMQDVNGNTALHFACENADNTLCTMLLDNKCDVSVKNKYGNNALWTAVFNCKGKHYELVELLMKYSPDIHSKNKAGKSPLDFAKQINDCKLIDILTKL